MQGQIIIPLTQEQVAVIDMEDAERVLAHNWCAWRGQTTWYAEARVDGGIVLLHRFILEAEPGEIVDHWNRDGLLNTRRNLRIASKSQNSANQGIRVDNTSGFKGVSWDKRRSRWVAHIKVQGKRRFLGSYDGAEAAARAYDAAACDAFGEFANLNFPD